MYIVVRMTQIATKEYVTNFATGYENQSAIKYFKHLQNTQKTLYKCQDSYAYHCLVQISYRIAMHSHIVNK